MFSRFTNLHGHKRQPAPVPVPERRVACVRIGQHSIAQGDLVWERNGMACIQMFSQRLVGEVV